tara:strand:- start:89 stop:286 length:198 start_codon:yes stop_codon:yes gene_type:complete
MDIRNQTLTEVDAADDDWETSYRRSYSERDKHEILEALRPIFRTDKEAWDDLRRRELMEQVEYDV